MAHNHRQVRVAVDVDVRVDDGRHIREPDGFGAFLTSATASVQGINRVSDFSAVGVQ